MDTTSHWLKTAALPVFPRLDRSVTVDVAVVGAGLTGITAAYLLKKAGLTVALVERGRCAQVDTGHTTAHLTAVTDLRLHDLQRRFSANAARLVWQAGMVAIDRISALARAEEIECGFRRCPGYLHAAVPGENINELKCEAEAAATLGIGAQFQPEVPLFGVPGVMFPDQAMFHPLLYLAGLVRKISGEGSHVFEQTDAHELTESGDGLKTKSGKIHFKHLVLATHNPLTGNTGLVSALLFQTKLSLYTSYALSGRLPADTLPAGCYWDTADPYHYLRVEKSGGHDLLVYGGGDHKTGQETDTVAVYARLEEKLRQFAPAAEVDARWSGQVIETNDGLPFIGETAERQFAATGFSGNGMTFGTLGAMMAVDHVLGRANPWQKLFNPHRKKFRGGTWTYLKENKDYPALMVRDWLKPPEAGSLREVGPGEGKVVSFRGHKVAAYRDHRGRVSLCSAVCTHLQCIVGWNPAEKTWDCPAHGSRFQTDGRVISGPAEEPLPRLSPATGRPLRARRAAPAKKSSS
ncbi:MAG: puuB 1 [Lacunisphaera sp.]|nr:puuB 1 [Lacunisphaera sp.]